MIAALVDVERHWNAFAHVLQEKGRQFLEHMAARTQRWLAPTHGQLAYAEGLAATLKRHAAIANA
jgi:hypothetical protein